jgi:uncharacterized RDD family membrane protein YckC
MEQDRLDIETPEHVRFSYTLAGFGSRFLAALLDHIIQGIGLSLFLLAFAVLAEVYPPIAQRDIAILAVVIAASAFLFIGYYIIFEIMWNGQTPGKRRAGLRVIRDNGTPITFTESLLRNLLRPVDMLPAYYGVGIISMLISRQSKRLGDFVAGTVVVRERVGEVPQVAEEGVTRITSDAQVELLMPLVATLPEQDREAVERFVERRDEVEQAVRTRLATKLSSGLRARLGQMPAGTPDDPEAYIELLYLAIVRRRKKL